MGPHAVDIVPLQVRSTRMAGETEAALAQRAGQTSSTTKCRLRATAVSAASAGPPAHPYGQEPRLRSCLGPGGARVVLLLRLAGA
jgi:hypothetical protein